MTITGGPDPATAWWAADFLRVVPGAAAAAPTARGFVQVTPEEATALVEGRGFRPRPVRFRTPRLRRRQWDAFCRVFTETALFPAALHAGYLPRAARSDLARAGVRLIPAPSRFRVEPADAPPELRAAGCALAASWFADDPLRLLRFRGGDPDVLLAEIVRPWRAAAWTNGPVLALDELEGLLTRLAEAPTGDGSLLPTVRAAEAFRHDPVLRGSLARLYTKVAERTAALASRAARQSSGAARRSAPRIVSRRARK